MSDDGWPDDGLDRTDLFLMGVMVLIAALIAGLAGALR